MKISFISVGHKHDAMFASGIKYYSEKINHYYKCEWVLIQPPKMPATATADMVLQQEMPLIEKATQDLDMVVLLDERGKMLSSPGLAETIEHAALHGKRKIGFLIGGAFGVHADVRKKAHLVWQLSDLVFPHQLVRLMLSEQVYRACTITRNEKYHHA